MLALCFNPLRQHTITPLPAVTGRLTPCTAILYVRFPGMDLTPGNAEQAHKLIERSEELMDECAKMITTAKKLVAATHSHLEHSKALVRKDSQPEISRLFAYIFSRCNHPASLEALCRGGRQFLGELPETLNRR
jgi:hypothetical protein